MARRAGAGAGRRGVLLGAPPAAAGGLLLLGGAGRARAAGGAPPARAPPAGGRSFYDFDDVEQFGKPEGLGGLRGGVTVAVNVASA